MPLSMSQHYSHPVASYGGHRLTTVERRRKLDALSKDNTQFIEEAGAGFHHIIPAMAKICHGGDGL